MRSISWGAAPSRVKKLWEWNAGALRAGPPSSTNTRRRARPNTKAALRPALLAPTIIMS